MPLKHPPGQRNFWRLGTPPFRPRQPRRAASRPRRPPERLSFIPRPPLGLSVRRAGRSLYALARPSLPSGIAWGCRGGELLVRPPPTRCELGRISERRGAGVALARSRGSPGIFRPSEGAELKPRPAGVAISVGNAVRPVENPGKREGRNLDFESVRVE